MMTDKIRTACEILGTEQYLDCDPDALIDAARGNTQLRSIINRTMFQHGWRWMDRRWKRPLPQALEKFRGK